MSRYNTRSARPRAADPITTTGRTTTHEGGAAYTRDTRGELLMLAVVNMVGNDTFYESAGVRDDRFTALVRTLAVEHPAWMVEFVRWLRGEANMRSAALVAAAETVKARLDAGAPAVPGYSRLVVDAALQRADEPGELIGYWTSHYGRAIPKPIKRGVADAVRRLYGERSLLKYDTASKGYRFADVLNLVHAAPAADKPWQGELFGHALDRRHHPDEAVPSAALRMVTANAGLRAAAASDPRVLLDADALAAAGMTWEDALSLAGARVDRAELWSALVPSMGYMALLRNLRNLDEAGVPDHVAAQVAERLADPEQVARSRQFPYRFLSAHRAAPSLRWGHALDVALNASCANVPALTGRTLVLVDTSASMTSPVSARSQVRHVDVGALFGAVLARRGNAVDLVGYADGQFEHRLTRGGSVLRDIEAFTARIGEVGHGTETVAALRAAYRGHERVVIISDMQAFAHPGYGGRSSGGTGISVSDAIPATVPMFGVDTTGYAATSIEVGTPNRHEIGGFSDRMFTMLDLMARGRDAGWPWEHARD
ncbi:TROVE domain-containing protein [Embleya sp. NPDC050154]|uniref:TROVE domain-containing protein n=1 Tax=Embleya sp. NPDC050154 TaxID=3363988 RepID=UPI00379AC9AC